MRSAPVLALGLFLAVLAGLIGTHSGLPRPAGAEELRGSVSGPGGPLAGALVRIKGTATTTTTDARGCFRLTRPSAATRVTAWKPGYLIGGSRLRPGPLDLRLSPLPAEDNEAYQWVDPGRGAGENNCANCHAEIYREWSASGHRRAAAGRHFRNLYEGTGWDGDPGVGWGLLNEFPNGAGVCGNCHAPAIPDGDPARFDLREVRGVAAKGVHCDYCHKIEGLGDGTLGVAHGRFNLRLLRPKEGQLFFGPLDDVDRGEDAYTPLYHQSRYCAACHEGIVFGVPVYTTYSEWLKSPARKAGKQCQDCHMTPTGKMTNFAPGHGGLRRDPRTLASHRFFDGSQADMLRRCLRVSAKLTQEKDRVRAEVTVSAEGVGHRVPTGFIDRHLILVVEGRDAGGKALAPVSGPRLPAPAGKGLAGRPGRLYAKLYQDFDGNSPAPFWRAGPEPQDNRLEPGKPNRMTFEFPAGLSRVRVPLIYRRFWEQVAREKGWPDRDLTVLDRSFPR